MANSYLRYPDKFFGSTRMLSPEQRGIYNDILDLYVSRDGLLEDNDKHRAYDFACSVRVWKRVRDELMKLGKISIVSGNICPNNGEVTLKQSLNNSERSRNAADIRWANYRKLNESVDAKAYAKAMPSSKVNESKESKRKAAARIPENFKPNEGAYNVGKREGYSRDEIDWLGDKFCDWAIAGGKTYIDWNRAFYTWIKSDISRREITGKRSGNRHAGKAVQGSAVEWARKFSGISEETDEGTVIEMADPTLFPDD